MTTSAQVRALYLHCLSTPQQFCSSRTQHTSASAVAVIRGGGGELGTEVSQHFTEKAAIAQKVTIRG